VCSREIEGKWGYFLEKEEWKKTGKWGPARDTEAARSNHTPSSETMSTKIDKHEVNLHSHEGKAPGGLKTP